MKPRRAIRFLTIAVANAFVIAVVLEVGARALYPVLLDKAYDGTALRKTLSGQGDSEGFVDPFADPAATGHVRPHPYLGFVGASPDTPLGARFDDRGFPFHPDQGAPPDDAYIIAISGGSVAASFFYNGAQRLRERLTDAPLVDGRPIQFRCYAIGGFKQPQQLMALNYALLTESPPDMWINIDGYNELVLPLRENADHGVPLEFPRTWRFHRSEKFSRQSLDLIANLVEIDRLRERMRTLARLPVINRSAFALAVWEVGERRLDRRQAELIGAAETRLADGSGPQPNGRELRDAVELWRNASDLMADICAARNIRYVHALQPNQYDTGSKPLSEQELRRAYRPSPAANLIEMGYPMLRVAGESIQGNGVAFIDTSRVFQREARTVYIDNCCHVNQLGNDLLADALAAAIGRQFTH